MNKQSLQELWDIMLIEGWRKEWHMKKLVMKFLKISRSEVEGNKVIQAIQSLDLMRTPTLISQLSKTAYVRGFVHNRSKKMNGCLLDNRHSDNEILNCIDNFIWEDRSDKEDREIFKERRKKIRNSTGPTMRHKIKFRERDKDHNWNTVK